MRLLLILFASIALSLPAIGWAEPLAQPESGAAGGCEQERFKSLPICQNGEIKCPPSAVVMVSGTAEQVLNRFTNAIIAHSKLRSLPAKARAACKPDLREQLRQNSAFKNYASFLQQHPDFNNGFCYATTADSFVDGNKLPGACAAAFEDCDRAKTFAYQAVDGYPAARVKKERATLIAKFRKKAQSAKNMPLECMTAELDRIIVDRKAQEDAPPPLPIPQPHPTPVTDVDCGRQAETEPLAPPGAASMESIFGFLGQVTAAINPIEAVKSAWDRFTTAIGDLTSEEISAITSGAEASLRLSVKPATSTRFLTLEELDRLIARKDGANNNMDELRKAQDLYYPILDQASKDFGLPPAYLRTLASNETASGTNIQDSNAGAMGLLQVMPDGAKAQFDKVAKTDLNAKGDSPALTAVRFCRSIEPNCNLLNPNLNLRKSAVANVAIAAFAISDLEERYKKKLDQFSKQNDCKRLVLLAGAYNRGESLINSCADLATLDACIARSNKETADYMRNTRKFLVANPEDCR